MTQEPTAAERAAERRRVTGRRREDAALDQATFAEAFVALTDGIILTDQEGVVVSANPAAFMILGEDALIGTSSKICSSFPVRRAFRRPTGIWCGAAWFPREERMGVLEMSRPPFRVAASSTRCATSRRRRSSSRSKRSSSWSRARAPSPISGLIASLDLVVDDALNMPRNELALLAAPCGEATSARTPRREPHGCRQHRAGTFRVRAQRRASSTALGGNGGSPSRCSSPKARSSSVFDADADRSRRRAADAQVFANLISNASKYAGRPKVTVGAKSVDGYVRITVADEGPGIPLDEQNRLFQRFFRPRTVREQAGGLGLGLSICRAIVHAQGGDISIESTPGRGTSVHFTLPKARHLAEEAED